jgi:hypothetical protein
MQPDRQLAHSSRFGIALVCVDSLRGSPASCALGPAAVLALTAPLHHDVIQLLPVEDDGEEVDLRPHVSGSRGFIGT